MELVIRQATLADAAELARLRWDFSPDEVAASGQSYADFAKGFAAFLEQAFSSGNWAVWVAEYEHHIISNIYIQVIHKVPRPGRFDGDNKFGYITNVFTEREMRNKGIGRQVLDAVLDQARQQQLGFVVLWPSEESVQFYKRAGFVHSPDALELHF